MPDVPTDLPDDVLADALTNLWRAARKLAGPEGGPSGSAARHVRAAMDAFASAGLTVADHDGRVFDPGLALEVVAYEPRPGTKAETVLETVRPCVYRSGRRVQIGQVVVAAPDSRS